MEAEMNNFFSRGSFGADLTACLEMMHSSAIDRPYGGFDGLFPDISGLWDIIHVYI